MGNFFVSYDLNGKTPTHAEMDKHLRGLLGATVHRVLETVWYVRTSLTLKSLSDYVDRKTSRNDRVMVIDAKDAVVRNLLVPTATVQKAWQPAMPPMAPRPLGLGASIPLRRYR